MAKSVNVTFQDGTSNTYDNVPDDVTEKQIRERAQSDFPERKLSEVAEGAHPDAAPLEKQPEQSATEQTLNDATALASMAHLDQLNPITHPVHAAEAAGVASYIPGINRLPIIRDVKATREALQQKLLGNGPVAPQAGTPQNPIGGQGTKIPVTSPTTAVAPEAEMNAAQQLSSALHPDEMIEFQRSGNLPQRLGGTAKNIIQGMPTQAAPVAPSAPAPTTPSGRVMSPQAQQWMQQQAARAAQPIQQAAPTAENFLPRIAQMAKQYGPAVTETAGKIGRFLGSAPVLGAQLMAHSGELNTGEDEQLRLMHQKQDIERQKLANQHAQEWNRYKEAQQRAFQQQM